LLCATFLYSRNTLFKSIQSRGIKAIRFCVILPPHTNITMRIAINGFGRIGRIFLRTILSKNDIKVVAINDLTDTHTLAHLFKYDSVHRGFKGTVGFDEDNLIINGRQIKVFSQKDPSGLPWNALNIDLVIESTGKFASRSGAQQHLAAGAKQVIISAPASDKDVPTVVLGVNDDSVDFTSPVISNASCTTNNVAAMVKVLDDNWGIVDGYITTVHSMTGDQNLHDAPHKDLRRARAASASIIPTTTGAAKAITSIFPHLNGRLGGAGIRVPVLNGSLTDFTCSLNKAVTVAEINNAFKAASIGPMKTVLEYTEDPIVSSDILDNTHSCIFDAQLTSVVGGLVKVVGWYDNETGYSSRLADVVEKIKAANYSKAFNT
jgi:glyceraldehyde 3-phosphate dehydrogenase